MIADEKTCKARWGGVPNGERFRCYLCGHRFRPGDGFKLVISSIGYGNLIICDDCDGEDVEERWRKANEEAMEARCRFWWAFDPDT